VRESESERKRERERERERQKGLENNKIEVNGLSITYDGYLDEYLKIATKLIVKSRCT